MKNNENVCTALNLCRRAIILVVLVWCTLGTKRPGRCAEVVALKEGAFSGVWTVCLKMEKMEMKCIKETRIIEASLRFLGSVSFLWLINY